MIRIYTSAISGWIFWTVLATLYFEAWVRAEPTTAAMASRFCCPRAFWGYLELKPMTLRTRSKVDVLTRSFCVDTIQFTPSLHGGVVKEPE